MTALEILEGADEILADPSKWCKHRYESQDGAHCLAGAINKSAGWKSTLDLDQAKAAIRRHKGNWVTFNDARQTQFSDVKALLAAAIADLRSVAHPLPATEERR